MKPNRKKQNKHQHVRRSNRCIVGIVFHWIDTDPLAEGHVKVTGTNITHKNPIFRVKVADVVAQYGDYLTKNQAFRWKLDVDIHCHNGEREYINGCELEAICKFTEINDAALEVIEQLFAEANMAHYKHFKFTAEIKGAA